MAEIQPFCGIHYNPALVNDLGAVICPPYDIITPQMQQELYQRSGYNFVRLEYGRKLPQDDDAENKYTRSLAILEQWLQQGILIKDDKPAIYLHDHHFLYQGEEKRRRGITAVVRLEESGQAAVRPHEGTMQEPKSDRLNLLWALQANTSSIFTLFTDTEQQSVSSLLAAQDQEKPLLELLVGDGGEGHRIWAITGAEVIKQICAYLADKPLYIADGHHRYESALNYLKERRACSGGVSGEEPVNYVMMTLVELNDPGLIILPAHRLVRGISGPVLGELMDKLEVFFNIEGLPLNISGVWPRVDRWLSEDTDSIKLVLFGLDREQLFLLKLHDLDAISKMMPYFHSEVYKRMDVSILDHIILEDLLGLRRDKEETSLGYSYDRLDAVNKILEQEYQLTFLLSPVRTEVVKAIADAGDRMPRKSTYFYPKLPSGLICHRLV